MHRFAAVCSPVLLALLILVSGVAEAQSLNMTLVGQRNDYPSNSDIWGYRSPGGVELAIMGTQFGTTFINATNPAAPVEVAFIPGPSSIWRDIKTYQDHAYITNETGSGFQIVDLSNPLSPTLVSSDSTWFGTAHNVFADTANALLYFPGTDAPGMVIVDVSTPSTPTFVANYATRYVHDVFVANGIAYTAEIFDGVLTTLDVSSLPAITELDMIVTPGVFTHNTWATDDDNYVLTTDENSGGHVAVYDVSNPSDIQPAAEFVNPDDPTAIVHNAFVHGDLGFVSWYRTGLQVLDLSDPRFPQRIAFYDTFAGTGSGFDGAWGTYPYQPSGTIYVSDIDTGFYAFTLQEMFGTVEGILIDQVSLLPIPGALADITTENNSVNTWTDGFYKFSLQPGNYGIAFSAFGYFPDNLNVSVSDGVVTVGDFSLQPEPAGTLGGFVGEYGAYSPLNNVALVLDGSPYTQFSDAGGFYDFGSVPQGAYTLQVNHYGYSPQSIPVTITAGINTEINLALVPAIYLDDLESGAGWTPGVVGDGATTGTWEHGDPVGTGGGQVQPEDDHTPAPGTMCFVTGIAGGGNVGSNDVDGGATTLLSPVIDLSSTSNATLSYHLWYVNDGGSNPGQDFWVAHISNDGGSNWTLLDSTNVSTSGWEPQEFLITSFLPLTSQMRLRFVASDFAPGSIVEAAVDDIAIYGDSSTLDVPLGGPVLTPALHAVSPNPVRGASQLRFTVADLAPVRLEIYDVAGRRQAILVDEVLTPGDHEVNWDGFGERGRELAAGVYFLKLVHSQGTATQKLVVAR